MGPILMEELDNLISQYRNAETKSDKLIKLRLEAIVRCYEECSLEERAFADEITVEFCRLISLLKEQHKKELDEAAEGIFPSADGGLSSLTPFSVNHLYEASPMPFENGEMLLKAFYEHFKDKMVEVSLRDYVARINTFAYSDKYLPEMLRNGELGVREINIDPVLFTYMNIEVIVARFNTKDEQGKSVKQKLNIRSALKKLNEFKLIQQERHILS